MDGMEWERMDRVEVCSLHLHKRLFERSEQMLAGRRTAIFAVTAFLRLHNTHTSYDQWMNAGWNSDNFFFSSYLRQSGTIDFAVRSEWHVLQNHNG